MKTLTTIIKYVVLVLSVVALVQTANASEKDRPYCFDSFANGTECATYGLIIVDWIQTRQIKDRPDIVEANTEYCGKNPSESCTALWMTGKLLIVYGVNHWLPSANVKIFGVETRTVFNVWLGGEHAQAVENNWSMGLKVRF